LPGGNLILMVPQHANLFSKLDKRFGHLRRYDRENLIKALTDAGFEVRTVQDFNRLGYLGWLVFSKLLQEKELPTSMMWLFNRSLPIAKHVDSLKFIPGVSLVAVARKPGEAATLIEKLEPECASNSGITLDSDVSAMQFD
jgi:hypothetical protein